MMVTVTTEKIDVLKRKPIFSVLKRLVDRSPAPTCAVTKHLRTNEDENQLPEHKAERNECLKNISNLFLAAIVLESIQVTK